ncbi:MAG: tetratricopeptide repeat protein [Rubrivivax sp.]|nr:tetratricopeptide repeat protein [Rubrivivax sp.]
MPPVDALTRASFDEAVRMLKAGRLPEAERAFRALAEKQPQLAGIHANLGLIHRKAGRLAESAAALQRAVELSPKQAAYHNQLGITWRALGRFDHARKAYETAIELDPAHAGALVNLAILHDLYLGEPARAAELYTRGAALLPAEAATINKWLAELKNRKADPRVAASAPAAAPAAAPATAPAAAPVATPATAPAATPGATPRKEKE